MKKLLIITLLTITDLTLEAMQQAGQQAQDKVPKLYTMIINKVLEESIDKKQLSEELQKYPEPVRELVQEEIKKAFIASFNKGNQIKSYDSLAGHITLFSDGSIRIDNYLGIGNTFYLSNDLQRYLHKDAAGNDIVNSLDKEHVKSKPAISFLDNPVDYYAFPQGIEVQHYPYIVISSDGDTESGPFLKIRYPQDFEVEFKAGSNKIIATSHILSPDSLNIAIERIKFSKPEHHNIVLLLSLHKAITNLDVNAVKSVIDRINLDLRNRKKVVDYLFITDTALHRAIKKALIATGQQLEDVKAIIQMLLDVGANLEQKNIEGQTALQLTGNNPQLMATIEQAYARRFLLDAINSADRNKVNQVIITLSKQGYTIPEFLNTSYDTDTPLVYTLKRALETTTKTQFDGYITIAKLLISNGATFNNPSGDLFLKLYGKQYVERIAPVIK